MSEEEKYKSIIQEIKDIYIYLTQGEPTPDDEITAREKLIKQIQNLKALKSFNVEANMPLFEDTLNKLNNWDTLELWFVESELPENIERIIRITDEVPEFQPEKEIKESPIVHLQEDLEAASVDIDQIVDKLSEQFKGEIDDLKQKIEILKLELEKKDETLKQVSQNKVIKKIRPKKDIKLPPPKIKLPVIKKPDQPPQIKAPTTSDLQKPKITTGLKKIEEVQIKIEEELEKLKTPPFIEQKLEIEKEDLPKSQEQIKISEISEDTDAILGIPEEAETPTPLSEPSEFTEMPEKPKKSALVPEIIEVETPEEEKKIPFASKAPKIIEKPEFIEDVEEPKIIIKKPKITSVSIEEVETESIQSTGTELFNVFSSVGEKKIEDLSTRDEAFSTEFMKEKKTTERTDTMPFVEFGDSKAEISESYEGGISAEEELPTDKDSLYQELIALEGKRYSLEKTFKELEKIYSTGAIDDSEYKKQSDELRGKLNGITSKINRIRRVISSL
ncbi:MAG: hypothetical protein ACFFB6_10910 [Promethearchaeota archaeon]